MVHEKGIVTILSMSKVTVKYRVTYDSTIEQGFVVHKGDGETRLFTQAKSGLFYLAILQQSGTALLIDTVEDNMSRCTPNEPTIKLP
jgi:hypothetical protein